jgi:hypothetical protein
MDFSPSQGASEQDSSMEDDDADYAYAMQLWEQEESETGGWVEPAAQPAAKRGGGGRDCGAEAKSVLFSFPRRKSKAVEGGEEEEEEEGDVVQVSLPFEGEDNIVRLSLLISLLFLLLLLHVTNAISPIMHSTSPKFADSDACSKRLARPWQEGCGGARCWQAAA